MASMNLLNMKKEIKNLNNIVEHLKNENSILNTKCSNLNSDINMLNNEFSNLNDDIIDIKIKKPNNIEIINFVDEIKEEISCLSNKIEQINKKRFFKEIVSIDKYNEAYNFLCSIDIEERIINVILFLNYNTIQELCQLNIEDLILYNISKQILEYIIKKACEKINNID